MARAVAGRTAVTAWRIIGSRMATQQRVPPVTRRSQFDFLFGIDGISLALMLLTTLLTVSCVLISWESISDRAAGFYACLLLLEAGLIGVFSAFDLILFYVFFEFTLVPLFFLIGIWGGPQRRYAAVKFFLYTFVGSLVTLVGLVRLVLMASSAGLTVPTSIPALAHWLAEHPLAEQHAGRAVPGDQRRLHGEGAGLPAAHMVAARACRAPTAGSVLLAGVLLEAGHVRHFATVPADVSVRVRERWHSADGGLGVAGIIYGSLCALAQRDIKKLVAYSSVAHLGFCVLGLFALNAAGISGGVLQMINHGLSTGALFLLVGMVYDRYHTRQLDDLGGLAARLPLLACIMVFVAMSSIGLPGLNGFVGEVLSLAGMFRRQPCTQCSGRRGCAGGLVSADDDSACVLRAAARAGAWRAQDS